MLFNYEVASGEFMPHCYRSASKSFKEGDFVYKTTDVNKLFITVSNRTHEFPAADLLHRIVPGESLESRWGRFRGFGGVSCYFKFIYLSVLGKKLLTARLQP